MFIRSWKTEILTIPNLLSLLRLGMIPVCARLYLGAQALWQYRAAGMIIALSCLTDALDGKIARKFHMESTVGKILDPLADKLTQLVLTLCLSLRYPVLKPVLVLLTVKETAQTLIGYAHLRRGKILPGALMAGKVCTTVLFVTLTTLVLFPDIREDAVRHMAMADCGFLSFSFVSYLLAYYGNNSQIRDLPSE